MKSISSDYTNHLASHITTEALLVKILTKDNTTYLFTNCDIEIEYDGDTYLPNNSFIPTELQQSSGLSVDNLDITGIVSETDNISEIEIISKKFYDAKLWLSAINYKDTSQGIKKLLYGTLGEVTLQENKYVAEFRSLTFKLTRNLAQVYSKTCRVELGSEKCGVNLSPDVWESETVYDVGDIVSPTSDNGRIYYASTGGISDTTEPSWNTTIGGTTSENTIIWEVQDSHSKSGTVLNTNQLQLVFDSVKPNTRLAEVRFEDSSNTNIPWTSCSGDITCSILNDINTGTYEVITNGDTNVFTFSGGLNSGIASISLTLNDLPHDGAIYSFTLNYKTDTGEWSPLYTATGLTQGQWATNSNAIKFSFTPVFYFKSLFYTDISVLYADVSKLIDGVVTFTSGSNNGLSMEIIGYNEAENLLYLVAEFPHIIEAGDTFNIIPGCDHQFEGSCKTVYNNGINFRGEPYIPTEDVLVGGIGENNKKPYTE